MQGADDAGSQVVPTVVGVDHNVGSIGYADSHGVDGEIPPGQVIGKRPCLNHRQRARRRVRLPAGSHQVNGEVGGCNRGCPQNGGAR